MEWAELQKPILCKIFAELDSFKEIHGVLLVCKAWCWSDNETYGLNKKWLIYKILYKELSRSRYMWGYGFVYWLLNFRTGHDKKYAPRINGVDGIGCNTIYELKSENDCWDMIRILRAKFRKSIRKWIKGCVYNKVHHTVQDAKDILSRKYFDLMEEIKTKYINDGVGYLRYACKKGKQECRDSCMVIGIQMGKEKIGSFLIRRISTDQKRLICFALCSDSNVGIYLKIISDDNVSFTNTWLGIENSNCKVYDPYGRVVCEGDMCLSLNTCELMSGIYFGEDGKIIGERNEDGQLEYYVYDSDNVVTVNRHDSRYNNVCKNMLCRSTSEYFMIDLRSFAYICDECQRWYCSKKCVMEKCGHNVDHKYITSRYVCGDSYAFV